MNHLDPAVHAGDDAVGESLSIFSRTWAPMHDAVALAAVIRDAGFPQAHLNLASLGLPPLGDGLTRPQLTAIGQHFQHTGIGLTGISATYNMIDPNPDRARRNTALVAELIDRLPAMGVRMVSLCTGSRHPHDKWSWHPDNTTSSAHEQLRTTLSQLIPHARRAGVVLGIEPDRGNIINNTATARRLLRDLGDDNKSIGIILDPGNLITPHTVTRQIAVLDEAFDELDPWIVAVHAKDTGAGENSPLGSGIVDFPHVFRRWTQRRTPVPIVIHDVAPDDVAAARAFVLSTLAAG